MRMKDMELFRLEDRVLFEAAAVAEIVDAAEAAQENPNANVNETEKQAQDRDALKNAPPENSAAQAGQNDGKPQGDPSETADVDAQVEQLIQGEIPAMDGDAEVTIPEIGDSSSAVGEADENGNLVDAIIVSSDATISSGKELVVINGTVPDKDAILAELKPNQEVLILEDGTGLAELNEYLDAHEGKYDAIHLITHGNDGYLSINGEIIDAENFSAAEWADLGEHLADGGDILLYGCDTAATEEGRLLIDRIAEASGADVAASMDATGISGDWTLEYQHGGIDSAEISVENFKHNLINYTVTNLDDSGNGSLRWAIEQANNNTGTDEITFSVNGTIKVETEIKINDSVDIIGNGAEKTILDGQGKTRIFSIDNGNNISLTGIAFQNGSNVTGGAISSNGNMTISNCIFSQNRTPWNGYDGGGAIYSSGILNVTNSTFIGNSSGVGGAIQNIGTSSIVGCLFTENGASSAYSGCIGGAIYNSGILNISNCTFSGNVADLGGGAIRNSSWGGEGLLSITNCTFTGNTVNEKGGAIHNEATLYIADSSFVENRAGSNGGAIYNTGNLYFVNSIATGNRFGNGERFLDKNNGDIYGDIYGNITAYHSLIGGISNGTLMGRYTTTGVISGLIYGNYFPELSVKIINNIEHSYYNILNSNLTLAGCKVGSYLEEGITKFVFEENGNWIDLETGNITNHDITEITTDQLGNTRSKQYVIGAITNYDDVKLLDTPSLIVTTADDIWDLSDGKISFREALAYAGLNSRNTSNSSTITFDENTFSISNTIVLNTVYGAFQITDGTFSKSAPLSINGNISNGHNISFDGNASCRIFNIGKENHLTLNNLILQNAKGSAIYHAGGSLVITNSVFTNNSNLLIGSGGGAVYSDASELIIINSVFTNNEASTASAIYANGDSLTVINSTFVNNGNYSSGFGSNNNVIYNKKGIFNLINSILVGNGSEDIYNNGEGKAYYSLIGNVFSGNWSNESGTINNAAAEDVFWTDTNGNVVIEPDGIAYAKYGGLAHGKGIYVWHNEDYSAIAYSVTIKGQKTAITGNIDDTTTCIATDQQGRKRIEPVDIGALIVTQKTIVIDPESPDFSYVITAQEYDGTTTVGNAVIQVIVDGKTIELSWKSAFFNSADVLNVTTATFNDLSCKDNSYVLSSDSITLDATEKIIAKDITVTADAQTKVYGSADPELTYQVSGLVGNDTLSGELTRATGEDVGDYAITQGTLANSNYNINFIGANLTITAKELVIDPSNPVINPDDPDPSVPALSYTVKEQIYDGDIAVDNASIYLLIDGKRIALTYGAAVFNSANVLDVSTITFSNLKSSDNNYALSIDGITLDATEKIIAKDITVTADAQTKVYGSADPELTYQVSGLVGNDTLSGELTRATGEDVGEYAITQGTLANSNYNINFIGANLTITAKELVIDPSNPVINPDDPDPSVPALSYTVKEQIYDGDIAVDNASIYLLIDGKRIALTYGAAVFNSANVLDVSTITFSNLKSSDNNYALSIDGITLDATEKIIAKDITVTADAQTKVYGSADPELTYQVSGLVGNDTLSGELSRAAGEDVGDYAITQGTLANSNYNINFIGANLTITAKELVIDPSNPVINPDDPDPSVPALSYTVKEQIYDGDIAVDNASIYLLIDGKRIALTYGAAVFNSANVLDVSTITFSNLKSSDNNYALSIDGITLDATEKIIAKDITVTADAQTKVYGSADPELTYQVSGLVGNDTLSGELTRATGEDVGDYAITQGTLANSNYNINFIGANLTITAKELVIDPSNPVINPDDPDPSVPALSYTVKEQIYDGDIAVDNASIYLLIDGKRIALTYGAAVFNSANVLDVSTITFSNLKSSDNNYALSIDGITLDATEKIIAKDITVTADAQTKVYGSADPELTYQVSGLVGNDTLSGELSRAAGEDVGDYAITQGTLANSNYNINFIGANLTITAKELVIDPSNPVINPDDPDPSVPALSYTVKEQIYDGDIAVDNASIYLLIDGKRIALTYGAAVFNSANVLDVSTITFSNLKSSDNNYALSIDGITLDATEKIIAKDITVTADAQTKVYGSADPELTYQVSGLVGNDTLSGELTRATGEDVGDYAITQGTLANSNYNINFIGANLTITAKELVIDPSNPVINPDDPDPSVPALSYTVKEQIYDGDIAVDNASIYLLIDGKRIALTYGAAVFNSANVLDVSTITFSNLKSSDNNYALSIDGITLDATEKIIAKDITVTADAQTKVYGSADPELTYQVSGLVGNDTLSGELTRATGEDVGEYAITQGTLANSNYNINFIGANLTITAKELVIDPSNPVINPDDPDPSVPALSYTVKEQIYDGDIAVDNASIYLLIDGKRIALTYGAAVFNSANVLDVSTITFSNLKSSDNNYALSIDGITLDATEKIIAKDITVTADAQTKVYGSADPELTYQVSGLVGNDTLSGELSRAAGEDVGDYAITQGTLANSNYNINFIGANLTITAKELVIDPSNPVINPDDPDPSVPALSYTVKEQIYDGDIAVDNASIYLLIDGKRIALTYGAAVFNSANVLDVSTITFSNLKSSDNNYALSIDGITLDATEKIIAKDITVTADAQTKVYGSADPELTYQVSGLVGNDTLSGELTRATGEDVGDYAITQGTLANSNYNINFIGANLTITAKELVIDPSNPVINPDDPDPSVPALSYTVKEQIYDGDIAVDNASIYLLIDGKRIALTYGAAVFNSANVLDVSTITFSNLKSSDNNYALSIDGITLDATEKIIAKDITVTADAQTKVYGSADPELTYQVSGLVGNDTLSGELTRATGEDVGEYAITQGTLANSNYNINFIGANLTITAKELVIDPSNPVINPDDPDPSVPALSYTVKEQIYDGDIAVDNASIYLLIDGKRIALTYGAAVFNSANVLDVSTITFSNLKSSDNNYALSIDGITLDATEKIIAKDITVTADAQTKVYGSADPELTYQVSGLVGNDTLSGELSRAAGEDVGDYAITQGTLANSNYNINFIGANLTITAKELVIDPSNPVINPDDPDPSVPALSYTVKEQIYDGDIAVDNASIYLLIDGKRIALTYGAAVFNSANVLDVSTITFSNLKSSDNNYALSIDGITLDATEKIIAKDITVTADAQTKVYGSADPELTYQVSGLVGNDTLSGELTRATGEDVGEYAITQGTLANSNYKINFTGANLTITAKSDVVVKPSGLNSDQYSEAVNPNFSALHPALTGHGLASVGLLSTLNENVYAMNHSTLHAHLELRNGLRGSITMRWPPAELFFR